MKPIFSLRGADGPVTRGHFKVGGLPQLMRGHLLMSRRSPRDWLTAENSQAPGHTVAPGFSLPRAPGFSVQRAPGFTQARASAWTAFTLVELLVVIAIIGVLVALLLPAVQAAREAARRTECKNHLKQIGISALLHVDTSGFYPSGGWHWAYAGDADLGFGKSQPGAWPYSLLPYLEQQALHALGSDGNPDDITAEQRSGTRDREVQPIATFHCPSRRAPIRYPAWASFNEPTSHPVNSLPVTDDLVAKTDYAINGGSDTIVQPWNRPPSASHPLSEDWKPKAFDSWLVGNGIGYFRSEVKQAQVTDGTTNTFLIGEKFQEPFRYEKASHGDHHGMYGLYHDTMRYAGGFNENASANTTELLQYLPLQDADIGNIALARDVNPCCTWRFGSAHPGAFQMAMCDGSVQAVPYDIDPLVYDRLGNREDGEVIGEIPF